MIKLKEIYAFPVLKLMLFSECVVGGEWFPEVPEIGESFDMPVLNTLDAEKSLSVNQVYFSCEDGERTIEMYTVYYHGMPVMIVQKAGRGGEDFFRRFVTNATGYGEVVDYLRNAFNKTTEDCFDPEADRYIDDVLSIYGNDVSEQFGLLPEPKVDGLLILHVSREELKKESCIILCVEAFVGEVPKWWRKGSKVFETGSLMTHEERKRIKRYSLVNDANKNVRVYWAKPATAPDGVTVPAI